MAPGERTFDEVLFLQFVEISKQQASALATLAERQRRDDEMLERIDQSQRATLEVANRIADRLQHMDEQGEEGRMVAVNVLKHHITTEIGKVVNADRWKALLMRLVYGVAAAAIGALAAIAMRGH